MIGENFYFDNFVGFHKTEIGRSFFTCTVCFLWIFRFHFFSSIFHRCFWTHRDFFCYEIHHIDDDIFIILSIEVATTVVPYTQLTTTKNNNKNRIARKWRREKKTLCVFCETRETENTPTFTKNWNEKRQRWGWRWDKKGDLFYN